MSALYEKIYNGIDEYKENVSIKVQKREKFESIHTNKILVVGLGQLGLPVAKYAHERGFDVYGYDIRQKQLNVQKKQQE